MSESDEQLKKHKGTGRWSQFLFLWLEPGIREVCEAEKALGQLWRKTAAGRISSNPCPRKATGERTKPTKATPVGITVTRYEG